MSEETGKLFIVSTPIGNLEDITIRALKTLRAADLIAAEDTRRTRILLSRYRITKPLTSLNSHNEHYKGGRLIEKILSGVDIAIVSDAGTPGISDPATSVISSAVKRGIKVVPVPGATAAVTALSLSGLPTDRFFFEGFLPRKKGKREKRFKEWEACDKTVIFYESPYRIIATLSEMVRFLGNRDVVVARELTKLYEEIIRGPLDEVIKRLGQKKVRGEFTVVVGKKMEPDTVESGPDGEVFEV
ncbi:MAG: 16S rRNA (cytidine(1402)-2'-O)-methyltransferase [Nitrospinota bacterium]